MVKNIENKKPCIVTEYDIDIYDQNSSLITDGFEITNINITLDRDKNFKIYMLNNFMSCKEYKFKVVRR